MKIRCSIVFCKRLPEGIPCPKTPRSGFTGLAGCADVNSVGETQTAWDSYGWTQGFNESTSGTLTTDDRYRFRTVEMIMVIDL